MTLPKFEIPEKMMENIMVHFMMQGEKTTQQIEKMD